MATGTDVLTPTLEDRIKTALEKGRLLFEDFEIDGIQYHLGGWPSVRDGEYSVIWHNLDTKTTHAGQQNIVGYHDDIDFEDHYQCTICNPSSEEEYWAKRHVNWAKEMSAYGIDEWNPESEIC